MRKTTCCSFCDARVSLTNSLADALLKNLLFVYDTKQVEKHQHIEGFVAMLGVEVKLEL